MNLKGLALPDPEAPGRMRDWLDAVRLSRGKWGKRSWWKAGGTSMRSGGKLRGLNTLILDFNDDTEIVEALFDYAVRMEVRFARAVDVAVTPMMREALTGDH